MADEQRRPGVPAPRSAFAGRPIERDPAAEAVLQVLSAITGRIGERAEAAARHVPGAERVASLGARGSTALREWAAQPASRDVQTTRRAMSRLYDFVVPQDPVGVVLAAIPPARVAKAKYVFTKMPDGSYSTLLPDGAQLNVWRGWSRLGGEGWQTRPGGRAFKNRDEAVAAELRRRARDAQQGTLVERRQAGKSEEAP